MRVIAAIYSDRTSAERAARDVRRRFRSAPRPPAVGPHADGAVLVVRVDGDAPEAKNVIRQSGGRIEVDVPEEWLGPERA